MGQTEQVPRDGRTDAERRTAALLAAAGAPDADAAGCVPLTGGTYNTVVRAQLPDGRRWVVKIPPPPGTPGLGYEKDLLRAESEFCSRAAELGDVPVPRLVHAAFGPSDPGGPGMVTTHCPGTVWHECAGTMDETERRRLRRLLGQHVARLHTVTGPGYGYPGGALGPLAPTWGEAFTAMTDALLADAEHHLPEPPLPLALIRRRFAGARYALDDVTRPALVHFDLWQGNLLLDGPPGRRVLSGIIDGERMFWGDPVADFVSLALFEDIEDDRDFLAGYAPGGGRAGLDDRARLRLALYRAYLYLIMLVEAGPRGYGAEQRAWLRDTVAPRFTAALADVADRTR
ncbi:phosphotransferase family protein [Streptomyces sp. t39]|uniref:phosphotransferase family protein n=1 Tax=Streptomyces sp. t39 TaxID=1828156 RepID=UPI0011CE4C21|nr:aminoglycoside phosphotransferase family protein [Streptomyces sp. t39]TXS54226.1 aminoglycoside phosphotransferase family protein [Streptomyces sp. t39]